MNQVNHNIDMKPNPHVQNPTQYIQHLPTIFISVQSPPPPRHTHTNTPDINMHPNKTLERANFRRSSNLRVASCELRVAS